MKCRICNKKTQKIIDLKGSVDFSVTSDGKIADIPIALYYCKECNFLQKNSSEELQRDFFNNFQSHKISNGKDQMKLYNEKLIPRSEVVYLNIKQYLKNNGDFLDIGSGNGIFAKYFKKRDKKWNIYLQDIQNNSHEDLLKITLKENIYIDTIEKIDKKFDFISCIQVINHVVDLNKFIKAISSLFKEDGLIAINTQNAQNSFSDLIDVDAINHFSFDSLDKLFSNYFDNYKIIDLQNGEFLVIISNKIDTNKNNYTYKNLEHNVKILKKVIDFLKNYDKKISIFGSSPLSVFLGNLVKNNITHFLDEDENRVGKKILGKNIIKPYNGYQGMVFLPFLEKRVIEKIVNKYKINFLSIYDLDML